MKNNLAEEVNRLIGLIEKEKEKIITERQNYY